MESAFRPADDPGFRLIETFGYVPGQGVARWALHLARLKASASHFGIRFDVNSAKTLIAQLDREEEAKRCRLTLAGDGALDLSTAAMPVRVPLWIFAIAEERLNAADPFLRHKTTRRALYDRTRAQLPSGLDELVFLNERGEVCEGTITNISITTADGAHLTPPLCSGCLPGVYRQSRLNKGLLREAVLTLDDLAHAHSINLTNSLRGSVQARWSPNCSQFASIA